MAVEVFREHHEGASILQWGGDVKNTDGRAGRRRRPLVLPPYSSASPLAVATSTAAIEWTAFSHGRQKHCQSLSLASSMACQTCIQYALSARRSASHIALRTARAAAQHR